jgi:hypothetical protein
VFRAFFFFLGCALVVAHRIVWWGIEAKRGTSDLEAANDDIVSLLKGAINDRGCAIVALLHVDGGCDNAKSSVGDSGMPRRDGATRTPAPLPCGCLVASRLSLSCCISSPRYQIHPLSLSFVRDYSDFTVRLAARYWQRKQTVARQRNTQHAQHQVFVSGRETLIQGRLH